MARNTEAKRAALRETLTDLAEQRIASQGLASLRARDLAKEAGCAVGAIYIAFGDLNQVVLAVNGRTFHRIGLAVGSAIQGQNLTPKDTLIILSHAYLRFAAENPRLWRALFDVELTDDDALPDWYREELGLLFSFISEPLSQVFPDMAAPDLDLMTRALFSSVHGMVLLGLERRVSGVPIAQLERMIELVLSRVTD